MTLSLRTLAAFAAPSLPLAALYFPVYVFLAEFYAAERGLSLGFIGAALIGVRLFDAISDPFMGIVSDRVTTRWGRRRIWLVIGAPVVMLATWCLFVPPATAGALWFAGFLFLLTLGWTVMLTPYFAWAAELTGDYTERTRVTVWRDTVGLVGTIAAALLYAAGDDRTAGMALIAAMIVIVLPLSVAWCLREVREPRDFSRHPSSLRSFLTVLRQEPLFLRLLGAYFINGAANALPATLFLFFVADRLGAPDAGGPLLVLYFGAAVLGAPVWTWAVRLMPKHRVWSLAMIYASAVFLCALLLGPGDIAAFTVICVLSGLALGADLALPSAMQADLVDIDTARSGTQRTGAFFALWSLATKAALALSGGLALIVLQLSGFQAGSANGTGALTTLAILYALVPVILKAIAITMMWGFPMNAADQASLRSRIEAA